MIKGYYLIVCFLLSLPSFARTPLLTEINPNFEPYLYQVIVPGSEQIVLLLGTQHNIPLDSYPEVVSWVAAQSEVFVTEITYPNLEGSSEYFGSYSWLNRDQLTQLGLLNYYGFGWTRYFDPHDLKFLNKKIAPLLHKQWKVGLDQIHPVLIEEFLWEEADILEVGQGIDAQLDDQFRTANKPVLGLETDQDRLLCANHLKELYQYAKDYNLKSSLYMRLSSAIARYLFPNQQDIYNLPISEMLEYASADLMQNLADDDPSVACRNHLWVPKIKQILNEHPKESILIAVGVSHLPGRQGLFQLLSEQGYRFMNITRDRRLMPLNYRGF